MGPYHFKQTGVGWVFGGIWTKVTELIWRIWISNKDGQGRSWHRAACGWTSGCKLKQRGFTLLFCLSVCRAQARTEVLRVLWAHSMVLREFWSLGWKALSLRGSFKREIKLLGWGLQSLKWGSQVKARQKLSECSNSMKTLLGAQSQPSLSIGETFYWWLCL